MLYHFYTNEIQPVFWCDYSSLVAATPPQPPSRATKFSLHHSLQCEFRDYTIHKIMMEAHIPSVLPTTSPFSVGATADVRLAPNHDNPQGGWAKCRIIGLAGGGLFDVYMIQEGKSIYGVAEENLQLSFDNWTAPPMQMQAPGGGGGGAAPVPAPVPGEAAPAPAPAPGPGFEAPTPEPQHKAAAGGDGGKKAKAKAKAKKKKQQPQVFVDPAVAAATAAGLLAEAKANGTEPPVYKCEYFAEFKCCFESEDFAAVQAHEKQCVRNPFHSNCKELFFKKISMPKSITTKATAAIIFRDRRAPLSEAALSSVSMARLIFWQDNVAPCVVYSSGVRCQFSHSSKTPKKHRISLSHSKLH